MSYILLEGKRNNYINLVILNEIIQFQHYFPVRLEGDDMYLKRFLERMTSEGLLKIEDGKYYPTDLGRERVVNLYNKYYEFLKFFDIFCAVDLEAGEFAFSSIDDFSDDDKWIEFLNQERFSDVRVAVAEFKGIDPLEVVFMSFLNENRFDCGLDGWQKNLTDSSVWNEIEEICDTAISLEYLKSEGVIENVVRKGSELAIELIEKADEANDANNYDDEDVEEVTEVVTTEEYVDIVEMPTYGVDYWRPYYDPFYISPIWLIPVLY